MKKMLMITVLVLSMLMIVGCGSSGQDEPDSYDYRYGTEGLELEFHVNSVEKFYDDPNFYGDANSRNTLTVEVRNKGAYPQPEDARGDSGIFSETFKVNICIGGVDPNIIDFARDTTTSTNFITPDGINYVLHELGDSKCTTFAPEELNSLEGRSTINKEGGYVPVSFYANNINLPRGLPFYKARLMVSASYNYKTFANPMVCVDPNPFDTTKNKVCEIRQYGNVALTGSQGAPVAVTSVSEDVVSDGILFKIHVRNAGDGRVIPWNHWTIAEPDSPQDETWGWTDIEYVTLEEVSVGGSTVGVQCNPGFNRGFKLVDDEAVIYCKYTPQGFSVYETPLNIVLKYGYVDTIEKDIEVHPQLQFTSPR